MIDAHVHLEFNRTNSTHDIKELYHVMQKYDLEKMLLFDIDDDWYSNQRHTWDYGSKILPSFTLYPNDLEVDKKLIELKSNGVRFIKLLPYEQNILTEDYDSVVKLAKKIEQENMILVICASYGSKNIYRTNGIQLTEYLLRNGIKSPIIVAHGGMPKILDLYSLMCEYENIYFDLSFSIKCWWESSVVMDYAYVLKQIGYNKVFYGSDYPYVSMEDSLHYFNMFCDKYAINDEAKEKILHLNFKQFLKNFVE